MGKAYFVSNNVQIHVAKQCNDIGPRTVHTLNNVFKVMQNYTSITPPPQKKIVLDQLNDSEKKGGGSRKKAGLFIFYLEVPKL